MDYYAALAYIEQFIDYERSPDFSRQARFYNLNRISQLLELLGNPHEKLKVVHVAGSKGKGSTAAIITSVLIQAGYKTGLFTSPHLITPRERCRIDNDLISEVDFAHYLNKIKPAIETTSESQFGRVSFFEIYTALAFTYFADKQTDFAVIEVGLGGRLDATNVVKPVISVITPIGLEHTEILGETYTKIAAEKAEIIKEGCPVAIAPQHPDALKIFEKVANQRNAPIINVKNIQLEESNNIKKNTKLNSDGIPIAQQFDIETNSESYPDLILSLLGYHQYVNATTTIAAIEGLELQGYKIKKECVYEGFRKVQWDGRLQLIKSSPLVILDGAHSPISMQALIHSIRNTYNYARVVFIVSLMRDKDINKIGGIIAKIADSVVTTQVSDNPRVIPADIIKNNWMDICKKVVACPNSEEAINKEIENASPTDLICITGSLYLVGQALELFKTKYEPKREVINA
ncbi:bifunctional folylpolyglutamate synthase/dihydrofolate synthase [Candidatus Poribacteria bacterium]|nr:bifunctional folylpolyglutamate synthase/dihydrofolate synthase [Candidatus Poribacteria bacterium]